MTLIDVQKLQELIDTYSGALTLYARQWCRAPEDAVQEALLELIRQNRVPEQPVAWLYTVVRRRAMNLARAEDRRLKHQRNAGELRESWFLPAQDGDNEAIDFESLLNELSQLDREIVVARIWGELSFVQIADLVEQPTSTVHRRYQKSLTVLGRLMNQQLDPTRKTDEPKPSIS